MVFSTLTQHRAHRALISVALGAVFAVLAVVGSAPAQALPSHCTTSQEVVDGWHRPTSVQTVSSSELSVLKDIIEALDRCWRPFAEGPGVMPAPSPLPSSGAYRGMGTDSEEWRNMAATYFAAADIDRVICLIGRESGGNPDARNKRTGAAGLLQVMPFWADAVNIEHERLFEPRVNLWLGRHILDLQGWGAWSPYLRGACH